MKKVYFLTLIIIFIITSGFLLLFTDDNTQNKRFLSSFGVKVEEKPYLIEEIIIPEEFDQYYESYNVLQIESGLTLAPYKGKNAIRYTYKVLNFPSDDNRNIFANVITVDSKPIAGDLNCPSISGFILPLSYFSLQK